MKRLSNSFYFKILLVGLLIRFFLMAVTFHSDLLAFHYSGFAFADNFVLNIYEYLHNPPQNIRLYGTDFFTWPPLAYFLLGVFFVILKPFFNLEFTQNLTPENLFTNSEIFKHLFLLKIPYLVFDLAAAFVILKLFSKEPEKKQIFSLWIFNPVSLYSAYMIGQFDIIPTFFVILALYFATKNRVFSLLSLGVGGALKIFPLLLILPAALILEKNFRQRLKLLILGFAPFVLTILPFLGSQAFRSVALFSAQSQKLLFATINVSGAEGISLAILGYFLILVISEKFAGGQNLWKIFVFTFLLIFSLTNFHPQWFIWITPFLIIALIFSFSFWPQILLIFLSFAAITLLFEPSLSFGLFSPLNSSLNQINLAKTIAPYFDIFQLKTILRSILTASSFWLAVRVFYFPDFAKR